LARAEQGVNKVIALKQSRYSSKKSQRAKYQFLFKAIGAGAILK